MYNGYSDGNTHTFDVDIMLIIINIKNVVKIYICMLFIFCVGFFLFFGRFHAFFVPFLINANFYFFVLRFCIYFLPLTRFRVDFKRKTDPMYF